MESGRDKDGPENGSTHLLAQETLNNDSDGRTKAEEENEDETNEGERLMPVDGIICSNKEANEVKFVSSDSQNGDAKIDIDSLQEVFAGMGKEELMKFANDPFWVRMRWFLFIFFWLVWAGMLFGAVAIIVMAPKCPAPPPLKWWEESPLYQVYVKSFKDGDVSQDGFGDLKGLKSEKTLDYLKSLGVKGIVLSSIVKSSSVNAIENFTDVDPLFGTLQDFKELATALNDQGIHLVMNLVPNHSSKKHMWFLKSEEKEEPYSNYYVWSDGVVNGSGDTNPPNNWKSLFGGSAWEWSDKRKQYYLHQFQVDQPDLNFHDQNVIDEFKDILQFWLDQGASGFEFDKIQYLLEAEDLKNEAPGDAKGTTHDQYEFYIHTHTAYLPGVVNILTEWKTVFENRTEGIFSVVHSFKDPLLVDYWNNSVVDVMRCTDVFSSLESNFTAEDLNTTIEKWRDSVPNARRRYWEFGNLNRSRMATRFSPQVADGLNIVMMLLEGTPLTYYGEELGMEDNSDYINFARSPMSWSNSTNAGFSEGTPWVAPSSNYEEANVEFESEESGSHLNIYRLLVKARSNPSVMYGVFESEVYNSSVYAYTRLKSGNPGYLVAFNPSDHDEIINFGQFPNMGEELSITIKSSNLKDKMTEQLTSAAVTLPAKGAFVATFVPKQK